MMEENLGQFCKELEQELRKKGLSRRDALKLAGVGTASFLLNPSEASAATKAEAASNAKGKIVIIGGGAAGCSVASSLVSKIANPDITIIEPNPYSVSYQPGQTLIAAGIYQPEDIVAQSKYFFPKEAKWIEDSVVEIDADHNRLVTSKSGEIKYDFLVVATGLQLNYEKIKGLSRDIIGTNGISSIYTPEGAKKTWPLMQKFIEDAKSGKKVEGIFTHPDTPIKCGGAPKKMMYLTNARLHEAGARENATLTFYPNSEKMFSVPEYHDAIVKQFEARDMKWHYRHNLTEVDSVNKVATFDHKYFIKGEWDEDLEEFDMIPQVKKVKVPFDFLLVTPPMSAPDVVKNSPLSWKRGSASKGGWVELKKETLQHTRYPNVFSLGDVAGIPMGKTSGSIRKQYTVVAQNLISVMEGKEPKQKYGGYTVCPFLTDIGKVMLAEFDWSGKPTPSFPLDPTKERWIWWMLKVHILKPMYFHGMLKGRA